MPEFQGEFAVSFNIPKIPAKRVVVVGGGFGGLKLCSTLAHNPDFQVVLIDKNNYHQFPPLIYQIATAGLHVNSITFPFRKMFAGSHEPHRKWTWKGPRTVSNNVYFRMCELRAVYPKERYIQTSIGKLDYDYLVIATGTTTNYFGNNRIQSESMPMKTVSESLGLRNALLNTFERANTCASAEERAELLNVVIVGGGPTGVEIAGALAEMREHVLPRDYPDLDTKLFNVHLVQGGDRLLPAMSKTASAASLRYLTEMGVDVQLNARVTDYNDHEVRLQDGRTFKSQTIIWVCGITGRRIKGLPDDCYGSGNRIMVDQFNRVQALADQRIENVFAIGDIAQMKCHAWPYGHPQMAQPAIQQGQNLARNFMAKEEGRPWKKFSYRDLGSMATIGRNRAVADIAGMNLTGFVAWVLWMGVHLMSILGVKNKISTLLDWAWSYITYDKSNRALVAARHPRIIMQRNYEVSMRHWGELEAEQLNEARQVISESRHNQELNSLVSCAQATMATAAFKKADAALSAAAAAAASTATAAAAAAVSTATAPAVDAAPEAASVSAAVKSRAAASAKSAAAKGAALAVAKKAADEGAAEKAAVKTPARRRIAKVRKSDKTEE